MLARHRFYNDLVKITPNITGDAFGRIASIANILGCFKFPPITRQFESKVFYGRAEQVSSVIHTPLAGSSVVESAQHYLYDAAGNIASR